MKLQIRLINQNNIQLNCIVFIPGTWICILGLVLGACGISESKVEQNGHVQENNDLTIIDNNNHHQGEELEQTEEKWEKDSLPDFILHPRLTTVKVGDTTIVISRPSRHNNYTLKDDSIRLARDQVIKSRIEKMTMEHPDWTNTLHLHGSFYNDKLGFLLYNKNNRPYLYFESTGKLLNVDKELAAYIPNIPMRDSLTSYSKGYGLYDLGSLSESEKSKILSNIRKNPLLPEEVPKDISMLHFELPRLASLPIGKETHILYQSIYYGGSDDWLIGGSGGIVIYDDEGNVKLHHHDNEDIVQSITILNDEFYAVRAHYEGFEGGPLCTPDVLKVINTNTREVVFEYVNPIPLREEEKQPLLNLAPEQPRGDAVLYSLYHSREKLEFYLVSLENTGLVMKYTILLSNNNGYKMQKKSENLFAFLRNIKNLNEKTLKEYGFIKHKTK